MKLPWTKRAEVAEERAEQARIEAEDTKAGWLEVLDTTNRARRHHEMNHWTATITTIFSGN